jgi:phospholipase D1/2
MIQESAPIRPTQERTLHQIADAAGTAYQCYATDPVWVTLNDAYPMTEGNDVQPLVTGEAYFERLAAAIGGAKKTIYMLGWQVNWDVMLKPGLRLYDALLAAAKASPELKIYVLPWVGSSHVPTYVNETLQVLNYINAAVGAKTSGTKRVFAVGAEPHPNPSAGLDKFFSHHQKQVVIDERIAFVGGMDVAYGRRDDGSFSLNAQGRHGNDSYNGCLPHLKNVDLHDYTFGFQYGTGGPARSKVDEGKVQFPADGVEIDVERQPRMPWQDMHLKIQGPAVRDLAINFVMRWNTANSNPRLSFPALPANKTGGCQVQMLRSASDTMRRLERDSTSQEDKKKLRYEFAQSHIHHAMVGLIRKAEHFIYIENQFFVSAFGSARFGDGVSNTSASPAINFAKGTGFQGWATRRAWGDEKAPPTNSIAEELGNKLQEVILNASNSAPDGKNSLFHVYITLPVHSEGMLNDVSTMTQVHYTMQSLVFGSQSLLNRTRRAILCRKLWEKKDPSYGRVLRDDNYEYEKVPIEECWPYITLLNLRNWAKVGDRYVTEQIYVHTKMMIVDDLYAIVGSANINDRSLLSSRDSELAVMVVDTQTSTEDIGAADGDQLTRKFARDLRMSVWKKLFCLSGATANVKPATGLADAVKRPAARGSWEAIRGQAEKNTFRYDAAFPFIPRNSRGEADNPNFPASIWPTKFADRDPVKGGLMPFEKSFWETPQHTVAAKELTGVSGFITLLPWLWTKGENNNSGYHSALYVENESGPAARKRGDALAANSMTPQPARDDEKEVTG